MKVHLVDGTYELYRHFFAMPRSQDRTGREVGGIVGVLASMLGLIESGATHLGVATDHVIESFRNDLWPGYKTGEGIEPELASQFHPLEDALVAMGVVVWPMVEFEADDALAAAAVRAGAFPEVQQVLICTPDKDLSQCVVGDRIVQLDRRQRAIRNEQGVIEKFGVPPTSIPDWLALVGDSADGYPGIPGWGAKSASQVLAHYRHLEAIPVDSARWEVPVRGATRLADALATNRDAAMLFRTLATLRGDAPVFDLVEELRWLGPTARFEQLSADLGAPELWTRARVE
ncbi:MAG: 5'-3' exonuclease H3TH domain-containing protein [Gemmatimonadales bacterium]